MKILVTGGKGYIGTRLVKFLKTSGDDVVTFDIKNGHHEDLRSKDYLRAFFSCHKDIKIVVHLAAIAGVEKNFNERGVYIRNDVEGTLNLLEVMREFGVNKILYTSSCSVYGNNENATEQSDLRPESLYGLSKAMCERLIEFYARNHGFNYQILRLFNVVGEGGKSNISKKRLIPVILDKIKNNKEISACLQSDGQKTCVRDYVDIEFVIKAINYFLNNLRNEIINIGSGQGRSVEHVIENCFTVSGKKSNIKYTDKRIGDPDIIICNPTKMWINGLNYKKKLIDIIRENA